MVKMVCHVCWFRFYPFSWFECLCRRQLLLWFLWSGFIPVILSNAGRSTMLLAWMDADFFHNTWGYFVASSCILAIELLTAVLCNEWLWWYDLLGVFPIVSCAWVLRYDNSFFVCFILVCAGRDVIIMLTFLVIGYCGMLTLSLVVVFYR